MPDRGTDQGVAVRDLKAPAWSPASSSAMGRRARSVTAGRRTMSGIDRMCSWISGARRSKPRTWVTRARVIRSLLPISAWLGAWPDLRRPCHSMALRRSSTMRGVLGSLWGLGSPRRVGMALTPRSAGTRRVTAPMLPFSKAPLGPSAISTARSRDPPASAHRRAGRGRPGGLQDRDRTFGAGPAPRRRQLSAGPSSQCSACPDPMSPP